MSRKQWIVFAAALVILPLSASAQTAPANDVGVFVTSSSYDHEFDFDGIEFEEKAGYGVSYNRFWSDAISTEFAAQKLAADIKYEPFLEPESYDLGEMDLTVISATAQWHFLRGGRVSPYAGVGLAYIQGEVETYAIETEPGEEPIEAGKFDLESETTLLVNGGVDFNVTPALAISLDLKYIAYDPKGEGELDNDRVDLNPFVAAAGLKFRF